MKTIIDSLIAAKDRPSHQIAIKTKIDGQWVDFNWLQYCEMVENIALSLIDMGIQPGDRVSIMSNTRYEWLLTDLAILSIGAVTIPIYQSCRAEEIEYIINNSEARLIFLEDETLIKKWNSVKPNCSSVKDVVLFNPFGEVKSWQNLKKQGSELKTKHGAELAERMKAVKPADLATVIYTSGTTGLPKGVSLTHLQIISEMKDVFTYLSVDHNDCSLTFLPYAHVFGRIESLGGLYTGFTLGFAESIETIRKNLTEIKPTLLIAVPRIFEKIYNGVLSQAESSKVKKKIFDWALGVGKKVSRAKCAKKPIPLSVLPQYKLAQKLVFNKLKEKLGGRLRFAVSGGAPLEGKIAEFFHASDLLIIEGYGLTETSAAITMNTLMDYEFGTVGKPFGDIDIKLADDGEILVKSDKVMLEYYKNPEATKEVFEGEYFKTGDIGVWTKSGNLKITDRKKDLIKTSGGKYVAPQKVEKLLKLSPYIANALVYGDRQKYIVSLITLDPESITNYAKTNSISFSNVEALTKNEEIHKLVNEAVASANADLSSHESVKKFAILPRDFSIEQGEMTPSLKIKRKACTEKHKELLSSLYGLDQGSI